MSVLDLDRPRKAQAPDAATAPLELTILMPCLNEAETIEVCVKKARGYLERSGVSGEVLIADNGSTDGSQAMARALGARVVDVPEKGYGAALIGGIAAARSKFIVMGDADDSYDFEKLDGMLAELRSGADLVMGNRFKGGIEKGAMPFLHRYLGNPVLSFIGRLFFKVPIGDFHCGLRGYNRQSMLDLGLKSPGMEFASEMVVKSALAKYDIRETPTTLKPDGRSRPPHLKTWRDGWRHLRFLLLHSPKWLFIYPGALLIAIGLVGAVALSQGALRLTPAIELGIHSLIAFCFIILIGVQMVMSGALGRRYAMVEGVLPPPANLHKFLLGLTLETILLVAVGVFLAGVGGMAWAVSIWVRSGFGPILYFDVMRIWVISLTAVACALQLGATGFLASVLNIRR
jgi:hypothetical protein